MIGKNTGYNACSSWLIATKQGTKRLYKGPGAREFKAPGGGKG